MRRTIARGAASAAVLLVAACTGPGHGPAPTATSTTPAGIPAAVDAGNPLRGQYVWDPVTRWAPQTLPFPQGSGNAATRARPPWPHVSTYYTRVAWSDLEASAGGRSGGFPADTVLERRVAAAAARGQRTVFRVVMADDGSYSATPRRMYPDYLAPQVREWRSPTASGRTMLVPDWNSPAYLAGVERLVAALGHRYDRDPRVVGVDISGYGTWGEWNDQVWGPHLPAGYQRLTPASTRRIVDATVRAFPTQQLFALTDPDLLRYALARSPRIGIRFDCLGQWAGGGAFERILSVPGARDRWRTAPVATETCQSNYDTAAAPGLLAARPGLRAVVPLAEARGDLYANARAQVLRWHVSLVSSGNFPGAGAGRPMSDRQVSDYLDAARWSGYRYTGTATRLPATTPRGGALAVPTQWSNLGVAPSYGRPTVDLELRPAGGGTPAAVVRSGIDLSTLVAPATPEGAAAPAVARREVTDRVPVPRTTPPGRYEVVAVVRATTSGVTAPLALAQGGRTPDGGHVLGAVTVR